MANLRTFDRPIFEVMDARVRKVTGVALESVIVVVFKVFFYLKKYISNIFFIF